MSRPTDITIENVEYRYEDFLYRCPIKFGGVAIDRATIVNVTCRVRTSLGKTAVGFGSMPLGNVWSFPSRVLSYDQTLAAMKDVIERIGLLTSQCRETGHPIELNQGLEPAYLAAAVQSTTALGLAEPIPKLCTLVAASPFDAAIHDAYGKVHGLSCYRTYEPPFLDGNLSAFLGPEFHGEFLARCLTALPKARMPLYHLIGALDPLEEADVNSPIGDGLPETLPAWIRQDGLTHLKIKLNGDELAWDVDRVGRVDRIASQTQAQRGVDRWYYSLDFNERCADVGYLLEFLARVRARAPAGFDRIQYIEQPTARDLKNSRAAPMHEAARIRPVVIDESLTDLESLELARERGYTGAALKACKGQSQAVLMAAAARKFGMFLCVQDLTCPGASLIHSAGLAAHVEGVAAIESNARQYCPQANKPWEARFPGIFHIVDGTMETGQITGPGLGAVP
jgi:L-alanine-DL-glutamate epimerase-like enolase superfamily enzyme